MNYAQKQLHEVVVCLQMARLAEYTLTQLARGLLLGDSLVLALSNSNGNFTTMAQCPVEVRDNLVNYLLIEAQARVKELEEREADCLREIMILAGRDAECQKEAA